MNTWLKLTLILISVTSTSCKPITEQVHACGKDLADILQEVCREGYNTHHAEESNDSTNDEGRKKRGITQECCLRSCTHYDLLEYCQNASSLKKELRMNLTTKSDHEHQQPRDKHLPSNEINFNSPNDKSSSYQPRIYGFAAKKQTELNRNVTAADKRQRKGMNVGIKNTLYFEINTPFTIDTRNQRAS